MSALKVALHKEAIAEARAARECGASRRRKRLWKSLIASSHELGNTRKAAHPTLRGREDISCTVFLSPWYIAKSDEHTKLSRLLTAKGDLATGRAESNTEERTTGPASKRLKRTAEKRGRLGLAQK